MVNIVLMLYILVLASFSNFFVDILSPVVACTMVSRMFQGLRVERRITLRRLAPMSHERS